MTTLTIEKIQTIIEAALLVAGHPLSLTNLQKLFEETELEAMSDLKIALQTLQEKYQDSGIELKEVASGFQFQARQELAPWLSKLWEERPPRYSHITWHCIDGAGG